MPDRRGNPRSPKESTCIYVDKEVQPTADFCASYDSIEDGVNAINNGAQVPSSDNGSQATSNTQGGKNE